MITLFIDRENRIKRKTRKFAFSDEINELIDNLVGSLEYIEKSKVMEVILKDPLIKLNKKYEQHKLEVKYKPTKAERIL